MYKRQECILFTLYNISSCHNYKEGLVFNREQGHGLSKVSRGGGGKNSYATVVCVCLCGQKESEELNH